ncbi:hypothetical protein KEM54_004353 [Ascosphaera aggregata]|nr:hypothetical protein KEM54_004353 [Ascosphaera aggregata]
MAEDTPNPAFKRTCTSLPLRDGCGLCGDRKPNLFPCHGCGVMFYCSREHEAQDLPKHQLMCISVASAREDYEGLELRLKQAPENYFTTQVARFWSERETQQYLRRRKEFADALYAVGTRKGVELRLQHMLKMLHLNREDDLGLRFIVPYLFLRLNQEQDCYDFISWWGVTSNSFATNWRNPKEPFMDKKNADPFENVAFLTAYYAEYGLALPTLLLKIKLRDDLRALQLARQGFGGRLLREIEEEIFTHLCATDVVANNKKIIHADADYWQELEMKLNGQIAELAEWVHEMQPNIWMSLHLVYNEKILVSELSARCNRADDKVLEYIVTNGRDAWEEDTQALEELKHFSDIGRDAPL